jgi:hypothetical protein
MVPRELDMGPNLHEGIRVKEIARQMGSELTLFPQINCD